MYKIGSFEQEIMKSMEKQLVSSNVETDHGFNKLAKAADFLNAAAAIFERAGLHQTALEISEVLNNLAKAAAAPPEPVKSKKVQNEMSEAGKKFEQISKDQKRIQENLKRIKELSKDKPAVEYIKEPGKK